MSDPAVTIDTKREPAAIVPGLIVPALMGLALFFGFNTEVQSAVDAVLMAAGGFYVMTQVDWRKSLPLLTGLSKAVFSLVAGLGIHMDSHIQVGVFALISAAVGWWTSTQVVAKPVGR